MNETFYYGANENFKAAEMLYESGLFNASANRAYYAVFHICIAFHFKKGYEPKIDRKNVKSMFTNELINRKKILKSIFKKLVFEMQNRRNDADYKLDVKQNDAKNLLKNANLFTETISKEFEK